MVRLFTEEKKKFIKDFLGFKSLKIENIKEGRNEQFNSLKIKEDGNLYRVTYPLKDFFGNYSVVLNFDKERNLLEIVKKNSLRLIVLNILFFTGFGVLFYLWIKRQIVERIINLITDIEEVKKGKKDEIRVTGKDEIGYLGDEINRYVKTVNQQIFEIEKNRKIYETIAEQSEAIIILFDKNGEILFANIKAKKIFNGEPHKIKPEHLFHLISEIIQINRQEKTFLPEFKLTDDLFISGWIIPVEAKEQYLLFIAHDITHLKQEKARLLDMASRDGLTSLYNRAFFEASFMKILNDIQTGEVYSLIFIDLDNLKTINDRFGHISGDRVIQETANSIRRSIRESDLASRWGGDEFVVLVKGNEEVAKSIAERIQKNLKEVVLEFQEDKIIPSISVGITVIDSPKDMETLIRKADKAAYDAKREGKSKIKIFNPLE